MEPRETRDELTELGQLASRQAQAYNPLSYPGEERHDLGERTETIRQQSFKDRVQALIDRIQALGQAREHGQEMG
jgi:hypothetical protein